MKLPIPYLYLPEVHIKNPDVNTILSVYETQQKGNIYFALLEMVRGCITEKLTTAQLRDMPIVNAEFIVIESYKAMNPDIKLESVFSCPRLGCGDQLVFEEKKDYDNRIDVFSLPVVYTDSDGNETIELSKPYLIDRKEQKIEIHSYTFRPITLGDQIDLFSSQASLRSKLNEILYKTLVDIKYASDPYLEFNQIKNRYRVELFNVSEYNDFQNFLLAQRRYGYQLQKQLLCASCGKEWEQYIDFTSFFAYGLAYMSKGKTVV